MTIVLVLLMGLCCAGPGHLLVRRLKWSASETLCASIGASILLIYLAATGVYLSGINWRWCWLISAIFAAMTIVDSPHLIRLLRRRNIRPQLAALSFLAATAILLLCLVRHYSGGAWGGDWAEHYDRAKFFLQHQPYETRFLTRRYSLPARPPMMNLVCAYFMAQVGDGYDLFQLMSSLLNVLVLLPCILLAGRMVKFGSRRVWPIAAFLAVSPVVAQNATFPWTKLLCAFFIILSIAFYLRGWRDNSPGRIIGAAASMAAALLVHYSAGPYAVFLALHYLAILAWRRRAAHEAASSIAVVTTLLATWFAWSIAIYGLGPTFASNTAVVDSENLTWKGNLGKIAGNLVSTIVPHPLRLSAPWFDQQFQQPNAFGHLRDYMFTLYQPNLLFSFGSIGCVAIVVIAWRLLRRAPRAELVFWTLFVVFIVPVGIAVHGAADVTGVAHICLQPLTLIGLTLLAAGFTSLPHWLRLATAGFAAFDAALGIVLQFRIQMQVFKALLLPDVTILSISDGLISYQGLINSTDRQRQSLVFLGDHFAAFDWLPLVAALAILASAIYIIAGGMSDRRIHLWRSLTMMLFASLSGPCLFDRVSGYRYPEDLALLRASTTMSPPELEAAMETKLDAVRRNPDSSEARYDLGIAQYYRGQLRLAVYNLIQAFVLDPTNRKARYAMLVLLEIHGADPGKTEAFYAEKVRLNPDDSVAELELAKQLESLGHPEVVRKRLTQFLQSHQQAKPVEEALRQLQASAQ